MKVGDTVMFVSEGRYARWFFGRFAVVENYTAGGVNGKPHCRVRWVEPVKYHGGLTSVSNFSVDKFIKC